MKRRTLGQAIGLAAVGASWPRLAAAAAEAEAPMPALGSTLALPAELPLLDGGRWRAEQAKGQVLVLYWWASWCPYCALQTPSMQALWDKQRSRGLAMLGISIDKRAEEARRYLQQRGYNFPSALQTPELAALLPKPSKALPVTCVLGRDGRVVMAEGGQLFPEDVQEIAAFL
jgi:peroxiredoxin